MSPGTADHKLILNEVVSVELRAALEEEAKRLNLGLNEVALRKLSRRFRVRHDPSSATYRESAERLRLKVPEELHRTLHRVAARDHITVRGLVINALAESYGLATIDPRRRPRRRK